MWVIVKFGTTYEKAMERLTNTARQKSISFALFVSAKAFNVRFSFYVISSELKISALSMYIMIEWLQKAANFKDMLAEKKN